MNVQEIAKKNSIGDVARLKEMLEQIKSAYEQEMAVDLWKKIDRKKAIAETRKVAKSAERLVATLSDISEETRRTMNFIGHIDSIGKNYGRPGDLAFGAGIPDYVERMADTVLTIQSAMRTIERETKDTFDFNEGRPRDNVLRVIASVIHRYWVNELNRLWTVTFHRNTSKGDSSKELSTAPQFLHDCALLLGEAPGGLQQRCYQVAQEYRKPE
jgi:hypothetical protein